MKKLMTFGAAALIAGTMSFAAHAEKTVVGVWETVEGKSHVQIEPCEGELFCGKIIWLKEPNDKNGAPKKDINNRNENLRDREIIGINLLKKLEKTGANEWDDGYIYNPEDGETYGAEMSLKNENTLEVKGCVLFLCKSQIWTRIK